MQSLCLKPGPFPLYAQLAAIFRDRIHSGKWNKGDAVPTLDELTREFGVARVTVRQAIQLLSEEGYLSSHRGRRTEVIWSLPATPVGPIFSSIGTLDERPSGFTIEVFDYEEFENLPPRTLDHGTSDGPYVRIRKRDLFEGMPYNCSENFVQRSVYERFPARAERVSKIARLVKDYSRPPPAKGYELIRVSMPTDEECSILRTASTSPVARVARVFLSADNRVLLFGNYIYRENEFALLREISQYFKD